VPRRLRLAIGLAVVAAGVYLALSPLVVASALDLPSDTTSRMINLRASWGGAAIGIGAFVAWLPALRPWRRAAYGLLGWTMAGVGLARCTGLVLDGAPDSRQLLWIGAEIAIVIGCVVALTRRRA
jgi:hypothetical protein